MSKKFYKTTIMVEVLSEEPLPNDMSLQDIAFGITDGDWSGHWEISEMKPLNGKETADALVAQGSDPSFFNLSDEGECETDPEAQQPDIDIDPVTHFRLGAAFRQAIQ
jgi:hypothetical protein